MDTTSDYMTSMAQSMTQEGRAEANECNVYGHDYVSDDECMYCGHVRGEEQS